MKRTLLAALSLAWLVFALGGCFLRPDRFRAEHLAQIDGIVAEEIEAGHVPGAVVLVGRSNKILYCKSFGLAVAEPYQADMQKDSVFDLASLSKPVATATSIMILADRGKLNLDDYVRDWVPAFACGGKEAARIRHLLTHTSGLPAYTNAATLQEQYGSPCPEKVIDKICSLEAAGAPGETFKYSCLGYIMLARIVEIAAGQSIDEFARDNIFAPLGMKHTTYNPPPSWAERIAATEIVDGVLLRGTVHDPLALLQRLGPVDLLPHVAQRRQVEGPPDPQPHRRGETDHGALSRPGPGLRSKFKLRLDQRSARLARSLLSLGLHGHLSGVRPGLSHVRHHPDQPRASGRRRHHETDPHENRGRRVSAVRA